MHAKPIEKLAIFFYPDIAFRIIASSANPRYNMNCLKRAGLETLADVVKVMEKDHKVTVSGRAADKNGLLAIRNLGRLSALEVLDMLETYGADVSRGTL